MAHGKRIRNLFDPSSSKPFKLSRSRLENFVKCPRCFYLDRRLGIDKPPMPGFTLNCAVDELLKKEFDIYRAQREPHPMMVENGVDAIPFEHPDLYTWRDNFKGVQYLHEPTNLLIFGAVDDLWIQPDETIIVADYKSTSKNGEVTLDDKWKEAYKRQMEIYQWLLRRNGFTVSDTAFFVYANANKLLERFDGRLSFHIQLLPYRGDDTWVEETIYKAHECLMADSLPPPTEDCEYCAYRGEAHRVE